MATHSKCFLIFSDSAYLEIPLMKRVRFTWSERQVRGARRRREGVGNGGAERSREGWQRPWGLSDKNQAVSQMKEPSGPLCLKELGEDPEQWLAWSVGIHR